MSCTIVVGKCADLTAFSGHVGVSIEGAPYERAVYIRIRYGSASANLKTGKVEIKVGYNGQTKKFAIPIYCVRRILDKDGRLDFRNTDGINCPLKTSAEAAQ